MLLMIVVLALAIIGVIFLIGFFRRPVTVGKTETLDSTSNQPLDNTEQDSYIVIPDISGYTRFMHLTRFAAGHAQFIVAQLLDVMIAAALPKLSPTRVEGDSVMFYAVSEQAHGESGVNGSDVASAVQNIVTAFYRKRAELLTSNLCPCEACQHIPGLELKIVVHRGDIMHYRLRGLEDLSGMAVIEAHRLLKNSVEADNYVLISETAARDVHLHWRTEPDKHYETYDGIGEVRCDLYLLDEETLSLSDVDKSPVQDMTGKLMSNLQTMVNNYKTS